MAKSPHSQQVQQGQRVSEEKRCSHCGTSHTSRSWRRHPTSGQRLCNACGGYADTHRGQPPPDSVLQRRPAQPRRNGSKQDRAQRRCLQCGSGSPGSNKSATWHRHPATGEEWLCTPCYKQSCAELRKQQKKPAAQSEAARQRAGRNKAPEPQQGRKQRRGGEGERPAVVTQPGLQAGPAAAAQKRARGQQQQGRQQPAAAGAASGDAASDPAAKRRRKQARPQRQPPREAQPVAERTAATAAADASGPAAAAAADGPAAAVVAPAGPTAGTLGAGPPPSAQTAGQRAPMAAVGQQAVAAAGHRGQPGAEKPQEEAEPDLYSLLQAAAEQAAAAASGLTDELAAAVAAALPLEPKKEAYLHRLLERHQYSAAAAFMEVALRGGGHLPPAS